MLCILGMCASDRTVPAALGIWYAGCARFGVGCWA
jgi:hypothetical protein